MRQPLEPCCCCRPRQAVPISRVKCAEDVGNSASFWPSWNTSVELVELPDYHWRSAVPIFDIAGSESGPEVFIKMMYVGFWPSPLSRGRRYNCTSYRSMQCLKASSESNTWRFYSSIGYAEWRPLASPPEVCHSFNEVLSTLRSVGDAHWARVVASALGVCLAGICLEGNLKTDCSENRHC